MNANFSTFLGETKKSAVESDFSAALIVLFNFEYFIKVINF